MDDLQYYKPDEEKIGDIEIPDRVRRSSKPAAKKAPAKKSAKTSSKK